jgi:hypothetical protein
MFIGNVDNFVCDLCMCSWIGFYCMFWSLLEIILYCNLVDEFMHVDKIKITITLLLLKALR